jgi:hypothetical protein
MRKNSSLLSLVERLARQEQAWRGRQFLAPVLAPGRARLRLEGLLHEITVKPVDFSGFGVFTMTAPSFAELTGEATAAQREAYFRLWPALQVRLLTRIADGAWLAWPVHKPLGYRPLVVGAVPAASPFELVHVGFDGQRGWYREPVLNASLRIADQLANALQEAVAPDELRLSGLTPGDRDAYGLAHAWKYGPPVPRVVKAQPPAAPANEAGRLRHALEKSGGRLRSYTDAGDLWNVHWIDSQGTSHYSSIRRGDLTVVSSGICLSGQDADFDLTSLVGVMEDA